MVLALLGLIAGLFLVIKGGDLFVDSSVNIARDLGIPRIVIGATIVSLATTTPELIVSSTASFMRDSGIALGNAIGSAIANIGLIVGTVALIGPVRVDVADFKRRAKWMLGSAVLVVLFSLSREISRPYGFALVGVGFLYLGFDYLKIRTGKAQVPVTGAGEIIPAAPLGKAATSFIIGLVLVIIGSRLLVTSGIAIAEALGIPSVIIGLSIIAIGTSLPEYVTGITAARKGVADLSIGNIVGANVLNLALITGTAAAIHPVTMTTFTQRYSLPWLFIFLLMFMRMLTGAREIGRNEGMTLIICYVLYLAGLILVPAMTAG